MSLTLINKGQDNLGHDIPELLPSTNGFVTVPLETNTNQLHSSPPIPGTEMTPIPSGPRLGRKTSFLVDIVIVIIGESKLNLTFRS
ncbi:hypothetical protein Bhyg_07791 [Pseudolycoriella hygida]|uniref:Uncharacterized protein n=1 Tax=Pseudolycoriella hygida TaxID=35572 RepID=A0A9Q0S2C0_9DIPT|nr:hypothetical protein Bhyg_07791 [Pseudolycoriella hygida]